MKKVKVQRNYKDTFFRMLFKDKEKSVHGKSQYAAARFILCGRHTTT